KRGGNHRPVTLQEGVVPVEMRGEVILALDEALDRLSQFDERLARVVEYKFFGGMTQEEIADILDLSPRTVRSDWRKARMWLAHALKET
ncbi:MAG: RNA polymerase subunit sigma-70, partial [Rhodothermaceae bacterium]|nr:RNA polymerase subunit sigma-70 [Rhodothermaceae bacterium]